MLWAAMNTEEPVCCCEDPVQPNEYFQKLNLYLVCLSHLVTVYQLLVLIQLTCAVFSLFSRVQLFVILWTVARQAPLSMGFFRQEHESVAVPSSRGSSRPRG